MLNFGGEAEMMDELGQLGRRDLPRRAAVAGLCAGAVLGGLDGTATFPLLGTAAGVVAGGVFGACFGLLNGLVLVPFRSRGAAVARTVSVVLSLGSSVLLVVLAPAPVTPPTVVERIVLVIAWTSAAAVLAGMTVTPGWSERPGHTPRRRLAWLAPSEPTVGTPHPAAATDIARVVRRVAGIGATAGGLFGLVNCLRFDPLVAPFGIVEGGLVGGLCGLLIGLALGAAVFGGPGLYTSAQPRR
jgi:hypothetical protein